VAWLEGSWHQIDTTVLPAAASAFDRVKGVLETDVLRDSCVAVLGVGSGGSLIARELAKSGVGRFVLVDNDRLEVGNVCRHECGLSDVGRLKVNAVRDLILDRNPGADVVTSTASISGDSIDELEALLDRAGVNVVVCATDNRESRMLVNRMCTRSDWPAIYAGVFRRAYGGQVMRVLPGLSPCYQCFLSALPAMAADREISSDRNATAVAYSDRPVAVEPGISSDIAPVALMVAKICIVELLSGRETTLKSLEADLVAPLFLWLNRREIETDYVDLEPMATRTDEFSILRWYGIGLPRQDDCAVCGTFTVEGVAIEAADVSDFEAAQ
jgi:molybdopterin/thiamine biosynthesis adenylyltransferase